MNNKIDMNTLKKIKKKDGAGATNMKISSKQPWQFHRKYCKTK